MERRDVVLAHWLEFQNSDGLPVAALIHELTKYGYTYFDIIMASSPEYIIMVTLLENRAERFADEH